MLLKRSADSRFLNRLNWVVLSSICLTVALSTYAFYQVVDQLNGQARRQAIVLLDVSEDINHVSSELAAQTQGWKDVLLRAYDAALYAKHLKEFREREVAVQARLQHTRSELLAAKFPTAQIDALSVRHRMLVDAYEKALTKLDPLAPLSYRLADAAVRGMDIGLRDDLQALSQTLAEQAGTRMQTLGANDNDEGTHSSPLYLLGALIVLLPLLTLITTVIGYRALRRIAKGDARARAIYDSIADAVVVTDVQGKVESINWMAQQLTGWTQQEAQGKPLTEVFRVHDAASGKAVLSPVEIVLRDHKAIPMSNGMTLLRHNGGELAIEDSASPVRDEHGNMFAVVMVFHDVSKRYALLNEIKQQQTLFQQTFDLAAVGMAHLSIQGKWLRVNKKLCEITGYSEEELLELSFKGVTHPDDLARDIEQLRALLNKHIDQYHTEKRYVRKNGQIIWVALTVSIVYKQDGSPDYGISIIEDIQARKNAELAESIAHEQYQALFDQMPEGVILLNESLGIEAFNQEALRLLEYSATDLGQLHLCDIDTTEDEDSLMQRYAQMKRTGRDDFKTFYATGKQNLMDVDVSVRWVQLPDGRKVFQNLFQDITEQNLAASQIEYLAYHDQLTGLPNRRLLQERMQYALSSAVRREAHIGVLYLDLDHFKDVNDALGHQSGDVLLQIVTKRLEQCVREEDTLARMGGDEFVIMLNDISSSEDAAKVAEKILHEISLPIQLGEDELRVTPSIGISVCPQDGRDVEDLLKYADAALYHAKQAGRSTYKMYTESLHLQAVERLNIERLLRKAVDRQEFELYYQPQINLLTREIVGCEALIRWNHPAMGQVSPARFIPVAEHSGLIFEIGAWVIREACRQAKQWHDKGLDLKVSLNVSARQFMRPTELLAVLRSALSETGVDPHRMEIELTESLLLDSQRMGEVLTEIRALGVHLALDDFGTGYSSLSYLRRFPITILKIDQSFVSNSDQNLDDAEMVKTIIGMAHNLHMTLVAEGVETLEQVARLARQGCEVAQGYHYSRPLPGAEFEALVQQNKAHGNAK